MFKNILLVAGCWLLVAFCKRVQTEHNFTQLNDIAVTLSQFKVFGICYE
tara:strand:- start:81024 stop:81170 length:147 start_codon:yes stop_codon:yes gene_type:complete